MYLLNLSHFWVINSILWYIYHQRANVCCFFRDFRTMEAKKSARRSTPSKLQKREYHARWSRNHRQIYLKNQVYEQWKLLKTKKNFFSDSNLAAYLISLEFQQQNRYVYILCLGLLFRLMSPPPLSLSLSHTHTKQASKILLLCLTSQVDRSRPIFIYP